MTPGADGNRQLDVVLVSQPASAGVAISRSQPRGGRSQGRTPRHCDLPRRTAGPSRHGSTRLVPNTAQLTWAGARRFATFGMCGRSADSPDMPTYCTCTRQRPGHSAEPRSVLRRRQRPMIVFTPHAWSWSVGGRLAPLYRTIERLLGRRSDAIVAVSEAEAEQGRAVLGGAARNMSVIVNGVDRDRFSPVGPSAERDPSVPLIVCVGRLCEQKGQDIAIRALSRLREPLRVFDLSATVRAGPSLSC